MSRYSPVSMPRRMRALIGDIILGGANLEHLVTMALVKEIRVDVFHGLIVSQKIGLAQKLSRLQYIVEAEKDEHFAGEYDRLSSLIEKFLLVRNTLAHSSCSHKISHNIDESDYYFQDINDIGTDKDMFSTKFSMYKESELKFVSQAGFEICQRLSELFGVGTLLGLSPGIIRNSKPPTPRSLRNNKNAKPKPSPPKSRT